ncbi:hypothetical protein EYF80_068392 [Liparis tanakae]|uniref:Uncharacterized protein n=1 Tax=Liparis tanakae TaxID=230148 RepID=A0A4Z2DYJ9_9TELE|nr:hypothetical protein EYF80_068392 [Liparis tanakae]
MTPSALETICCSNKRPVGPVGLASLPVGPSPQRASFHFRLRGAAGASSAAVNADEPQRRIAASRARSASHRGGTRRFSTSLRAAPPASRAAVDHPAVGTPFHLVAFN